MSVGSVMNAPRTPLGSRKSVRRNLSTSFLYSTGYLFGSTFLGSFDLSNTFQPLSSTPPQPASAATMSTSATRDVETQRMTTLIRPVDNGRSRRLDTTAFATGRLRGEVRKTRLIK